MRTSYLIRGEMYSLNRDSSCYRDELDFLSSKPDKSNNTFRPLRGPQSKRLNKETGDNLSKLVALKDSSFYESSIVESDKNLVLDILPAVSSIDQVQVALRNLNLSNFARDLGHFLPFNQQSYYRSNQNVCLHFFIIHWIISNIFYFVLFFYRIQTLHTKGMN